MHLHLLGLIKLWIIAKKAEAKYARKDPNDPVVIKGKTVDSLYGWCMAHPFNMLGRLPVLSVPSGIGGNGLPTGIQIVARHLDDERVFRVAMALEKAQPWLDRPESRPSI